MSNHEIAGTAFEKSQAPSTSNLEANDLFTRLQAEGNPQVASIEKAAAFQPYLPGLDPICSQSLPNLELGDDAMDHRMAINNFIYRQKIAGCFQRLQS